MTGGGGGAAVGRPEYHQWRITGNRGEWVRWQCANGCGQTTILPRGKEPHDDERCPGRAYPDPPGSIGTPPSHS